MERKQTKQPKHEIWAQAKEAVIHSMFPASSGEEALFDFTFFLCYLLSVFFSLPPFILGTPVTFYMYAHGTWLTSAEELSLSIVPA